MRRNCAAVKCRCLMVCRNHPTVVGPTGAAFWPAITEPLPRKLLAAGVSSSGPLVEIDICFFPRKAYSIRYRSAAASRKFDRSGGVPNRPSAMTSALRFSSPFTIPTTRRRSGKSESVVRAKEKAAEPVRYFGAIGDGQTARLRCRVSTCRQWRQSLSRWLRLS